MSTLEPLLSVRDVAETLSVTRSTAWKLIRSGELRAVRVGGSVRVRPADLTALLDRRDYFPPRESS